MNIESLITYKGRDTDIAFSASAEKGYQYPWITAPIFT